MPVSDKTYRESARPRPKSARGREHTRLESRRSSIPQHPTRPEAARCACGGHCPRCTPAAADVRIHPSAPEITGPLHARAVTLGQDIYFAPGEYQPATASGSALLQHELAHVAQTEAGKSLPASHSVSSPGDALENNANALAEGRTRAPLPAPPGTALRTPLPGESDAAHARRQRLLESIDNATRRLLDMLRTGSLLEYAESPAERGGTRGITYSATPTDDASIPFISYRDRDALLRRMVNNLRSMMRQYQLTAIPGDFSAPQADETEGMFTSSVTHPPGSDTLGTNFHGESAEWADLQAAYSRHLGSLGPVTSIEETAFLYLDPSYTMIRGAATGAPRLRPGTPSGAYIVVPDIERDPYTYRLVDGFTPLGGGSPIIELQHDDLGYYYLHRGRRIDVRSPWRSDTPRAAP
jgi:hypothetical protein